MKQPQYPSNYELINRMWYTLQWNVIQENESSYRQKHGIKQMYNINVLLKESGIEKYVLCDSIDINSKNRLDKPLCLEMQS